MYIFEKFLFESINFVLLLSKLQQIRKKVQQTQQNLQDTKSHLHFSEPRLNEEISSHHHRRASQRRPVNNNSTSTHITSTQYIYSYY